MRHSRAAVLILRFRRKVLIDLGASEANMRIYYSEDILDTQKYLAIRVKQRYMAATIAKECLWYRPEHRYGTTEIEEHHWEELPSEFDLPLFDDKIRRRGPAKSATVTSESKN